MTKGLLVCCPSPMFSKKLYFPILLHSFSPVQFLEQFPYPSPFAHLQFFFLYQIPPTRLHKSYPQSKTFLNIQAVPSSGVFCSKAVLITTPSSFMHFFSFFDMLPSVPTTTTEMTLMLLIFHIILISFFSSWYLSIFSFSFSLTPMSPGITISIMVQLLLFSFTTTITPSITSSGACSYYFSLLFRLHFPHNFQ